MRWMLANSEHIQNLAEAIALICAAFFFIWKTSSGYLFVNLSVEIKPTRVTKGNDAANHYLITTVKLIKGTNKASSRYPNRNGNFERD